MCFPSKYEKLGLAKTFNRLNIFGVLGIIWVVFYMGVTSDYTPHKSDFVEINMGRNLKKLKEISEGLKI